MTSVKLSADRADGETMSEKRRSSIALLRFRDHLLVEQSLHHVAELAVVEVFSALRAESSEVPVEFIECAGTGAVFQTQESTGCFIKIDDHCFSLSVKSRSCYCAAQRLIVSSVFIPSRVKRIFLRMT